MGTVEIVLSVLVAMTIASAIAIAIVVAKMTSKLDAYCECYTMLLDNLQSMVEAYHLDCDEGLKRLSAKTIKLVTELNRITDSQIDEIKEKINEVIDCMDEGNEVHEFVCVKGFVDEDEDDDEEEDEQKEEKPVTKRRAKKK